MGILKVKTLKEQEAKGLLSSLGLKTRLSKIPLFGDTFFWVYKINEIVNINMPEIHLKQPGFNYSACGLLTRNKENWKVYADWKYRFYWQKWTW